MSTDSLKLKIITPQGVVVEEQVSSVKLPSSQGQIGVLPQHERYVSILGIGVIEFESTETKSVRKIIVSEGFCNVEDDTLIVLADKVIDPNKVKAEDILSEKETAKLVLSNSAPDTAEWKLAGNKLKEIEALESCR